MLGADASAVSARGAARPTPLTPPLHPLHPLQPCRFPCIPSRPLNTPLQPPTRPLASPSRRARRSAACRSSARSARVTTTPRSRWSMRSTTGGRRRRWASRRRARCARRSTHPYTPLEPLASLTPLHPFTLLHLLTGVRDDPLGLARAGPPGRDRLAGGDGKGHGARRHPAQRQAAGLRAHHQHRGAAVPQSDGSRRQLRVGQPVGDDLPLPAGLRQAVRLHAGRPRHGGKQW